MSKDDEQAEPGWGGWLGKLAAIINKIIMLFAKGKGDNGKPS